MPKIVFVVPYRDREENKKVFLENMKTILEDYPKKSYKIIFAHQADTRQFNRGAMKNIGFLYIKHKYPNDYKNITFVFNDVDTMPVKKGLLNYETTIGNIKHFYGFDFALGGIVSITGTDFETLNGFPNFWAWGFEDNLLYKRAQRAKINVDRTNFYPYKDPNILQIFDGFEKIVNKNEFNRYIQFTNEGLNTIYSISCDYDESNGFLNISNFVTNFAEIPSANTIHDLRNGPKPFDTTMGILFNIPYRRVPRRSMQLF